MRMVSLVAYNRPDYTAQAINGVANALLTCNEVGRPYDLFAISIDPSPRLKVVEAICIEMASILSEGGVVDCKVYRNVVKMGVGGNHFIAQQRAYEEHGADHNVLIEDDAVVTPDALVLADWFFEKYGHPLSDYLLLGMCNHRDFGTPRANMPDHPQYLAEALHIPSPFAFAMSNHQWPFVKATWHMKKKYPVGWDWSLSMAMRMSRRKCLHPVLSRCKNIGREDGTNETPATFDQTQVGIRYSPGDYLGPYEVAARMEDSQLLRPDPWMVAELEDMWNSTS